MYDFIKKRNYNKNIIKKKKKKKKTEMYYNR